MAEVTKIQWCDHTFNPWRGCTKVSAGCAHCYAEQLSGRNPKVLGVWGPSGSRVVAAESQWREPLKWDRAAAAAGERRRVFCASLADVFEDWRGAMADASGNRLRRGEGWVQGATVSRHWYSESPCDDSPKPLLGMGHVRFRLFDLIAATPNLDWLLLTKRPENVPEFVPEAWLDGFPPNVWLGTSVEDQAAADARIPHLLAAPARVRFLSLEPQLGPVDLRQWLPPRHYPGLNQLCGCAAEYEGVRGSHEPGCPYVRHATKTGETLARWHSNVRRIDWVIVGGESGGGSRPFDPDWARAVRDQCRQAGVAFFFKQTGAAPAGLTVRGKGGDEADIPADLMVREFPV